MAITFECESCGKSFTAGDQFAGKTGKCKQCGHHMTIPSPSDPDGYGLDLPEPAAEEAPLPPRAATSALDPPRRPLFDKSGSSHSDSSDSGKKTLGGVIGVVIVIAGIGFKAYNRWDRNQARNAQNSQATAQPFAPSPIASQTGPILLPTFPDPGPAREIEPGISFREVNLGPDRPGGPPGWSGKIWIYLPSGDHAPKSLPCILITGAGSNLITGMKLADGDRAEHLPYVRAGFAVVAYELDGAIADMQKAGDQEANLAIMKFLNARAGLVNAHIALEYALKKVAEVDPSRISAAGHSSAGTLAVLFAENEPRLRSSVAFAPALDLAKRFGPQAVAEFIKGGIGDLVGRYSPRNNEANLRCPLFLFHARDDSNVPVVDSEAFARRAKAKGKSVTLDLVPVGDHYDSMIQEGIPHAIAWLQEQK